MIGVPYDAPGALVEEFKRLWPGAATLHSGCWFPMPVSMERKHIDPIKNGSYAVCEKTDGERAVMFLHQSGAFLVDRNLGFHRVDVTCKPSATNVHNGTVLDGELVRARDPSLNRGLSYVYLAFDCVSISGTPVHHESLWKRLGKCGTVCSFVECPQFTCQPKAMVERPSMRQYAQTVHTLNWNTDGFVFTPCNQPVSCGTSWSTFKLKSRLDNTIDAVVKPRPERGRYKLYAREKNYRNNQPVLVEIGETSVPESIMSIHLERILAQRDTVICECGWDFASQSWVPRADAHGWPMVRTDKGEPNSTMVVQRTATNVCEGIVPDELF